MLSLCWYHFKNLAQAGFFGAVVYSAGVLANEVEPCIITPGSRAKIVNVECTLGESKTRIDENTQTEIESNESYHLKFQGQAFASKRTFKIKDKRSHRVVLTVVVTEPNQVSVTSTQPNILWIMEGLEKLELESLKIDTRGKLILTDALEINSELRIKANSFYAMRPFSVKRGTFSLTYEEGFIPALNNAFTTSVNANRQIEVGSMGTILNPTKRRAALNSLAKVDITPPLEDLVAGYYAAFKTTLSTSFPDYKKLRNPDKKREFVKTRVIQQIAENSKKGDLGESLYQSYMTRKFPTYETLETKVGLNSFDAVHVGRENPDVENSPVKEVIITEVKFAKHGKPELGVRKIAGKEWRQLSLPYIQDVLKDMAAHGEATRRTARLIQENRDKVKLYLVVFDPETTEMVQYTVGDLTRSFLD